MSETIAHSRTTGRFNLAEAMQLATKHRSIGEQVMDILAVTRGPGKLRPQEYYTLRLFDGLSREQMLQFVGRRAEIKANGACNFDRYWYAVARDKLVYQSLLQGMGLPVPRLVGLYHRTRGFGGVPVLRTPDALAAFLREEAPYPMFGKPNDVRWSLGAASLSGYDAEADALITLFDERIPVADFVADLSKYAAHGYLLQERQAPAEVLAQMCGPALPTVRVMCITDDSGPRIVSTHIKLTGGKNIADNTWRSGNLIAAINRETGEIERALLGTGARAEAVTEHPDTGADIVGVTLPHWSALREVVCEATRCLSGFRLVGWDVALCAQGPVLVEVNIDPDWGMGQLVSRRGMWTPDIAAFVGRCAEKAKAHTERIKKTGA